ncbi:MAG: response regulator [Dehalococcoidales bacterium]|nr:response regulator [Dehalococcoidales bacterium]
MIEKRKINILLVEDTEEHVVLMKRSLERGKLKSRLSVVRDGQAALDFLHHQDVYADGEANPVPDLILLDLKLPKVSGLEVLQHIRGDEKLRKIPVVILTASSEGEDIIRSYQGGAESYLTKSVLFLNEGADAASILDTLTTMAGV